MLELDFEGQIGFAWLQVQGKQNEEERWHKQKYKIQKCIGQDEDRFFKYASLGGVKC